MSAFERALLEQMFRETLTLAAEMARIGNFVMARRELKSALDKLAMLESVSAKSTAPVQIAPPTIDV